MRFTASADGSTGSVGGLVLKQTKRHSVERTGTNSRSYSLVVSEAQEICIEVVCRYLACYRNSRMRTRAVYSFRAAKAGRLGLVHGRRHRRRVERCLGGKNHPQRRLESACLMPEA